MTDSTPHGTTAVRAATPARQPFHYPLTRPFVEPDWRRIPGYRDVTAEQWERAQWQRAHTVKNLKELREALGPNLTDERLHALAECLCSLNVGDRGGLGDLDHEP